MTERRVSIAVVGATGVVGQELLNVLEQRLFPIGSLALYASARSAGDEVSCGGVKARVGLLGQAHFGETDIVFLVAGEEISATWAPRAAEAGAVVIDTSQLYTADPDVPLVVPELNPGAIADYRERSIIASPDAVAIALAVALAPLHAAAGITRIVATAIEPVSGAGKAGVDEMQAQTIELLNGREVESTAFPQRIAFNLIPQVGSFLAGGRSNSEAYSVLALQRLLEGVPSISVTRVRAPFFFGTGIAVNIETTQPLSADEVRATLRQSPGIVLFDTEEEPQYTSPADVVGQDATYVGRVRADEANSQIDLWIALDNTRKGSSVNAVQIAEILIHEYL